TELAMKHWRVNGDDGDVLRVPAGDGNRAAVLGDPVPGVLKHLKIAPAQLDKPYIYKPGTNARIHVDIDFWAVGERVVKYLHSKLRLIEGNMQEEYPEQVLTAKYLRPDATVL